MNSRRPPAALWRATPALVAASMLFSMVSPVALALDAPMATGAPPVYMADAPPGGLSAGPGAAGPTSDPIDDDVRDLPARVMDGDAMWDGYGSRLTAVGDLNGDGAGELAVVSRNPWSVHLLVASTSGFGALGAVTLPGAAGDIYGAAVAGGGDLNGDGFDDLAITVGRLDSAGRYVYSVDIYYGSTALALGGPSLTIGAPAMGYSFASGLAIVDDLDGDGFADLVVSAAPAPSSPDSGMVWVYRGASGGLQPVPWWSYTSPTAGAAFGAGASAAGDLNGDGISDFVITTGGAPTADGRAEVYVFYGGAGGMAVAGPSTLRGEGANDGFGGSVGAGDFNGDGRSDLLVGAPGYDASSELQDAGRMYCFVGSLLGISTSPYYRTGTPGTKFASSVAGVGDLNGDGFDDAAVGAPLASADGPITNGQVFAFFGSALGLSTSYDITEAGQAGNDLYGITLAGSIDLDADGRTDLAVGASGRDAGGFTDAGSVYLYSGLRLRLPLLAPAALQLPDLVDGKALARAPTPYRLEFTFVYRGIQTDLQGAEQTLVLPTTGQRVTLFWNRSAGTAQEAGDFANLVEVAPGSHLSAASPLLHSFVFVVPLKFAWAFKEPQGVNIESTVRDVDRASASTVLASAFTVVSTLAFSAPLKVRRADGTAVAPGDFVRGGEPLSWSGGGLVYSGTAIVPPTTELRAEVASDGASPTPLSLDAATGDVWGVRPAKSAEALVDLHTVSVKGPAGELLAQASVLVRTDNSPPLFVGASVGSGTHLTESPAALSMRVQDSLSGVDGRSVEWSSSYSATSGFATWHSAAAASGVDVVGTASVPLEEGVVTWVQFRARDLVGNGFSFSVPLNVTLDYGAVLFQQAVPAAGVWSLSAAVPVTVSVSNDRAVPIDFGTLEYLVRAGTPGVWTSAGMSGRAVQGDFSSTLALPDGAGNVLYLRVRLADLPEVYQSPPFYLQVDTQPAAMDLTAAAPPAWVTGSTAASAVVVTDAASGPLESSIRFRYLSQGSDEWSAWLEPTLEPLAGGYRAVGLVPVRDGVDNFVAWKAQDVAGNLEVSSPYLRILGDSKRVGFERPLPAEGAKLDAVNRVSIDVTDGDGSGVDLSTVEYKIDMPGGQSTEWRSAGREGFVTRATVSVAVVLPEGDSVIHWRAQDAARTPLTESPPVTVTVLPATPPGVSPRLRLASPVSGVHYPAGVDIKFDASGSFDPDGTPITFRWSLDGEAMPELGPSFWVRLPPGEHTVSVVVDDGVSPSVAKTVRFTVDGPVGPPPPFSTPGEQGMLASIAGLLLGAAALRSWTQRARRELRR